MRQKHITLIVSATVAAFLTMQAQAGTMGAVQSLISMQ